MPVSSELNPSQKAAVEAIDGPLLMIAGPGAGKTKTLVERIVHLIVDENVDSSHILVATFTEKAAKELVTRVSNRAIELGIDINIADMYIGTLHSIFLRIIEEYRQHTRLMRNYKVLDSFEQYYSVYRHLKDFAAVEGFSGLVSDTRGRWTQAKEIADLVNKAAEEDLEPDKLVTISEAPSLQTLGKMVSAYRKLLAEENALDFSTIQSTLWSLINEHPEILEELRTKIQYLMVDEYQDTNTIQEKILLKLAAPGNRICVVGDDDQSLYRFRGATVKNILEFQRNFPEGSCKKIELVTNYRSHPGIIDFYNRWMNSPHPAGEWDGIDGEQFRYQKIIEPRTGEFPEYKSVVKVAGLHGQDSWHEEVYEFIMTMKDRGILSDYNQCAFLFRSVKNNKVVHLANFLESKGIPVFSPRSAMFFDREEIMLMIGSYVYMFPKLEDNYLKWNTDAHLDVWDYYERCKKLLFDTIRAEPETHKTLKAWCIEKAKLFTDMKESSDETFSGMFYKLLQFPMFSRWAGVDLSGGVQDLRPVYNLALFSQLISKYEYLYNVTMMKADSIKLDVSTLFNNFFRFLIDGGIGEYEDFDTFAPSGCVSFMTIHQSKGLEFPITFTGSLEAVPRNQIEQIDEDIARYYHNTKAYEPNERIKYFDFWRLYYTAFSRAQNLLVLTGAENNEGHSKLPSAYFREIYQNVPDWKTGNLEKGILTLEKIKPPAIKHEYSFTSNILMYENCPMQYRFFRELEFTPVRTNAVLFGTLVHQTIEDVHKRVLEGHPEDITSEHIENWFNANYNTLSKATRTYLAPYVKNSIVEHVNRYVDHAKEDWSIIQEAEVPVTLMKKDYILTGKIDLIRGKDGTVEIVDFKTEKKPDINSDDGRDKLRRYERQLEIYAHIIQERYNHKVSRMHLYYTSAENENPLISYDYKQATINKTISEIDSVVNKIEGKNFDHKHIKKCKTQCNDCDIQPFCWTNT